MELQAHGNFIFIITNYISAIIFPLAVIAVQEIVTNISNTIVA
jgi:hypothetical protein